MALNLPHVFGPAGEAALQAVLRLRPLMAFDFDGTLSPIVARPQAARIAGPVALRLQALTQRLPVAIVTGRALADVRQRLGFEPQHVVGNHGAEGSGSEAEAAALSAELAALRAVLQAHADELRQGGVEVEDKRLSVALHYRRSADRVAAQALVARLLQADLGALKVFPGKMVVNVAPQRAPDKAQAVHDLVRQTGAQAAFFAGDDCNDEPVFASAPAHWLTLRVGRDAIGTRARFCIDGPHEMVPLLDRVLRFPLPTDTRAP